MASSTRLNSSQTKDVFIQHISADIKEIQNAQCDVSTHMDFLTGSSKHAQLLCDHLDHIFMHGLYKSEEGYWHCVVFFTHTVTVKEIKSLVNVSTNIGRGRSWLNIALNEQVMESYLRMLIDNQSHVKVFYARESFLRDTERLSVLLTLMSGLDFVSFDLPIDESYLNISASPSVSNSGIDFSVKPKFLSSVTPEIARRKDFTLSDTFSPPSSSSNSSRSLLTSSLPANVCLDTTISNNYTEKHEEDKKLQQAVVEDSSPVPETDSLRIQSEPPQVITVPKLDDVPPANQQKDLPEDQPPKLSFLDRYSQLAEQEDDKTSELVLVSKKKKSSKGKKKKKKKNVDGATGPAKKDTENDPLERLREDEPVTANGPENESPGGEYKDTRRDSIPNISNVEESLEDVVIRDASASSPTKQSHVTDESINTESLETFENTSTNPFGDEDAESNLVVETQTQVEHKTAYESQFGDSIIEHQSIDYNDLLEGAAAFAVRKRQTPPREDVAEEGTNVDKSTVEKDLPLNAVEEELGERQKELDSGNDVSAVDQDRDRLKLELTDPPAITYNKPPSRPTEITDSERQSFDIAIDDNTRIVLSLDVFHHSTETAVRLVQAHVPQGLGRYQKVCVVITDGAVYLTHNDGTEGVFSHMMGVSYSMLDCIVIGLSWQSFSLLYREKINGVTKGQKQVVITGSEAVSKSVVNTIVKTAAKSRKTIQLKNDDESRTEAIEKELIKLGSETSMEIVRYCMVYWEQLSGEPPLLSPPADISVPISGFLSVKENLFLKLQAWSVGFFQLIDGVLYHFNSDSDKTPKSSYPMRGLKCGGCTRAAGENKEFAFKVLDTNGSSLVLAADDEDDMTRWMQALCLATIGEEEAIVKSPIQKGGAYCAVLLTQNKIHVLREDWTNGTVQLVASISVQDINEICVEQKLPVYCTLRYDDWETDTQGLWMLCFSSEYELGQFEKSLLKKYKEIFQVDLGFSELSDAATRSRVHQAIELMRASRSRSDSITRGRTVFTFDQS